MKRTEIRMFLLTLVMFLILSSSVSANDQIGSPPIRDDIEKIIEQYYDISYDIYLNMEMKDMSLVLDMNSIQSQNKVVALEEVIERWKYTLERGYAQDFRDRYPIFYDFKDICINGDITTVKVDINGDMKEAYPPFVAFGENTFIIKNINDNWLISEHDYDDCYFFERSKTEKIELNLEDLYRELEEDCKAMEAAEESDIEEQSDPIPAGYPFTDYSYIGDIHEI